MYIFLRPASGWAGSYETAKLTASERTTGLGSPFGSFQFDLSGDGNTLAAGSPNVTVGSNAAQGRAYVFVKPLTGWTTSTETAKLTASDGVAFLNFGRSVSTNDDGSVVAAGAAPFLTRGAVYVFTKPTNGWTDTSETTKLTASDGAAGDEFGISTALDSLGTTIVIGAASSKVGVNGAQGAAYVFGGSAVGNTAVGTNVVVQPSGTQTVVVTFSAVTQPGNTTFSTTDTGAPPPTGFKLGSPATYYEIDTTAGFSGPVTACINYGAITFGNTSKLRLFHFEGGAWADVTASLDQTKMTICGSVTSLSPFAIFESAYSATIQPPVASNGSSVFNANRGVVPVKFTLMLDSVPTCNLPPASIGVSRTSGGSSGPINASDFIMPADTGTNFRVDTTNCQYVYNLAPGSLGPGTYSVQITVSNVVVGSATFGLQ